MFDKISQLLGKVSDFGSRIIKPMKNNISNGFNNLKSGALKVGRFINDNHELIGSIVGGVGNLISNLPNSRVKDKMLQYGANIDSARSMMHNLTRPANTQRRVFNNDIQSKMSPGGVVEPKNTVKINPYQKTNRYIKQPSII